jgi:pimeloyl-ACP methyl ester carboxylesterase
VFQVLGMLYMNQNKMLYVAKIPGYPVTPDDNPFMYRSPADHGIEFEDVRITTSDGVKLHAWFLPSVSGPKSAPTLVFFHANAGSTCVLRCSVVVCRRRLALCGADMGLRAPNVAALFRHVNCNIVICDYRGYGHSEGEPDEEGLMKDADVRGGLICRGSTACVNLNVLIAWNRLL